MLRKLFILVCLVSATTTFAQQKSTPSKTTEKQDDAKIDYKAVGAPMPPLKVLLYKDTAAKKDTGAAVAETSRKHRKKHATEIAASEPHYLSAADVNNGANLLVMMFNPTCSHCQDETAIIKKNISLFDKTQLVMLANPGMTPYLHDFVTMMHTADYPQMHVGIDSSGFINNAFMFQMLPQINIYDKNRKLLKIFNGEVVIDSLKQYIQ